MLFIVHNMDSYKILSTLHNNMVIFVTSKIPIVTIYWGMKGGTNLYMNTDSNIVSL